VQQLEHISDAELKAFAAGGAIPAALEALLGGAGIAPAAERSEEHRGH
jgi:hypothetical protein